MFHKIIDNDLVAILKSKDALMLKKPVYIGMCLLDLSKVFMYRFHHNYIKNKYDNSSSLLFPGTDSLNVQN